MRHKHADIAEAFGNGKKIQFKGSDSKWCDWLSSHYPQFYSHEEWRVAPDEPEALYQWRVQRSDGSWFKPVYFYADEEALRKTYETARNVIRIEESRWVPPQGVKND